MSHKAEDVRVGQTITLHFNHDAKAITGTVVEADDPGDGHLLRPDNPDRGERIIYEPGQPYQSYWHGIDHVTLITDPDRQETTMHEPGQTITDANQITEGQRYAVTYKHHAVDPANREVTGTAKVSHIDGFVLRAEGDVEHTFTLTLRSPNAGLEFWHGVESVTALDAAPPVNAFTVGRLENQARDLTGEVGRLQQALANFERDVTATLTDMLDEGTIDDDQFEDALDNLGLEAPEPKPVTVEWTVTFRAEVTPADRDVAKKMEDGYVSRNMIEDALTNLEMVDVDPDFGEVDNYKGIEVEIQSAEVSDFT